MLHQADPPPLGPEHRFFAAADDCLAATRWSIIDEANAATALCAAALRSVW